MDQVATDDRLSAGDRWTGLVSHRMWFEWQCADAHPYIVVADRQQDGQIRISVIDVDDDRRCVRQLITSNDAHAIVVVGLLATSSDPADLCRSLETDQNSASPGGLIRLTYDDVRRCEVIHRAMREEPHAA